MAILEMAESALVIMGELTDKGVITKDPDEVYIRKFCFMTLKT